MIKTDEKGKSMKDVILTLLYTVLVCAAGYAAYFFADESYKIKQTEKAMEVIAKNMHASFDKDSIYPPANMVQMYPITPTELEVPYATEYFWRHYFGGTMLISGSAKSWKEDNETYYNVILNTLSKRKCKLLASYDWRINPAFVGVTAFGYSIGAKSAGADFKDMVKLMTEEEAAARCDCGEEPYCSVVLLYR